MHRRCKTRPHAAHHNLSSSSIHRNQVILFRRLRLNGRTLLQDSPTGRRHGSTRTIVRPLASVQSVLFTPWSSVIANCARGEHDVVTSFGLCGIICAILLFPIGLIFLWWAMTLVHRVARVLTFLVASIQRKNVHDVECGYISSTVAMSV